MHDPPSLSKGHLRLRRCSPAGAHGYLRLTFSTRVLAGHRAQLAPPPGRPWADLARGQAYLAWSTPPPPLAGVGRTDSRNAREICPCLHTNVCACLCTHIHIQRKVGLEGSRLPWGSGPTWQDLQETQMLPRVAASQRACGEGRPSSGGHQESAQWELSWLFSLRQKEVGKGKLGRGQPPLPTPRAPDSVPSRARSARWRRGRALPHPYLARTGWRGRSSECLRSWSPHTRTCLGPTPRCSLSARHLRGHSDRGQARVMGMGLDGIRAWVDQRLQISGPPLGTSAASGKLSLMSLRPRGWKQALHAGA